MDDQKAIEDVKDELLIELPKLKQIVELKPNVSEIVNEQPVLHCSLTV